MKSLALNCMIMSILLLHSYYASQQAQAEEKPDFAARAKTIAPFSDENTVAVARYDATRENVDALVDEIKKWGPGSDYIFPIYVLSDFHKKQAAFLKAGGRDIYLVFNPAKINKKDQLLMIIPLSSRADENTIRGVFRQPELFKRSNNALLLEFSRAAVSIAPDPRPELEAAFEAAGDTAVQLIFTPPKHYKRVIEEIIPQLPNEIGGGESRILTRGCLWAAIGVDLPPQTMVRLVIQSQDAASAAALRTKWSEMLQLAARQPLVQTYAPKFTDCITTLTPRAEGDRLTLVLDEQRGEITTVANTIQALLDEALDSTRRMKSMDNLKQIGLAMHNYHDANKHFPSAAIYSPEGKPLLSWRVMLLPYLEQNALYNEFHLDEPWDSPHNIVLSKILPIDYLSPKSKVKDPGRTNYVVPVGPGTVFEGREGRKIKEITDGTSHTIMAVEVDDAHAVIWTKPDDLNYDPKEPAKGLGGHFKNVFLAVFCDGSGHVIPLTTPAETLRAAFSAAGGDPTPNF